jgi:hypothetical protein
MLSADTIAWSSIALATIHSSFTDMSVIHGKYPLRAKEKLNIIIHQFVITSVIFGALFQNVSNIYTHMMILLSCASCWAFFGGCFMAQWQRENITYTPVDFTIIQKPKDRRLVEFLGTIVPLFVFDLLKLSMK